MRQAIGDICFNVYEISIYASHCATDDPGKHPVLLIASTCIPVPGEPIIPLDPGTPGLSPIVENQSKISYVISSKQYLFYLFLLPD
jgi:hypothetical protein